MKNYTFHLDPETNPDDQQEHTFMQFLRSLRDSLKSYRKSIPIGRLILKDTIYIMAPQARLKSAMHPDSKIQLRLMSNKTPTSIIDIPTTLTSIRNVLLGNSL